VLVETARRSACMFESDFYKENERGRGLIRARERYDR